MKKLFVTVAAALLAGAALAQMPDVKIENHQGDVINTSSLVNGKPTILSFWSTTCKPCLMELNTINDQLMDWLDEADFPAVVCCGIFFVSVKKISILCNKTAG